MTYRKTSDEMFPLGATMGANSPPKLRILLSSDSYNRLAERLSSNQITCQLGLADAVRARKWILHRQQFASLIDG